MNGNNFLTFKPRARPLALAGFCLFALAGNRLQAQEALRGAIAGDSTASSLEAAQTTIGYYNLLLGSTAWRFGSTLSATYDDNVTGTADNPKGDLIIAPSVNTQLHWPVSLRNSLDVGVDVGYSEYLRESNLSEFFITPGSGFSFDVYADNIKINLHDRISISQYGYQNPGAGTDQNLESLQNSIGVSAAMDLDQGQVGAGYDHSTFESLGQSQDQSASGSDNIFANVGYRVKPQILAGFEVGSSVITEGSGSASTTNAVTPSAIQYSAGVFSSAQLSEYLSGRIDIGYSIYKNTGQAANVNSSGSGFNFTATISHRLNKWLTYSIAAGRSTDLASFGQAQNRLYIQFNPTWTLTKNYSIGTPVSWQKGSSVNSIVGANDSDNYTQYTMGINLGRTLTEKLSGSIAYQFVDESGSGGAATYTATIISLSFNYQF